MPRDGAPQPGVARRRVVRDLALCLRPKLAGDRPSPYVVREKCRIREAASEVEIGRLGQQGRQHDRIPDRTRAQCIYGPPVLGLAPRMREMLADERAGARPRGHESLARESIIDADHRRARDRQASRELPAWRQRISGPQSAQGDRLSQLPVDLVTDILAADQADVQLHGCSIGDRELVRQTLRELALPSVLGPSYLAAGAGEHSLRGEGMTSAQERFVSNAASHLTPSIRDRGAPREQAWRAAWVFLRFHFGRPAAALVAECRARRAINHLRSLDDDRLRDLGLIRKDIERVVRFGLKER